MSTLVVLTIAGGVAAAARADYLTGDPRKCPLQGPDKATACAHVAAVVTFRQAMGRRLGLPDPLAWSAVITCRDLRADHLKWSCDWGPSLATAVGTAKVTFRAQRSGWRRLVVIRCAKRARRPPLCA